MPFAIVRNDISNMSVDAVVNAANSSLAPGGGVCGAIFAAAGLDEMQRACRAIGHCDVGQAVVTDGFALAARYVIHAVGPIWQDGMHGEPEFLKSCYRNALARAQECDCKSVAFPLISTGTYGFPKAEALKIAVSAISEFLLEHDMQVYLVVFDSGAALLGKKLFGRMQSYIDEHYIDTIPFYRRGRNKAATEAITYDRQLKEQAQQLSQDTFLSDAQVHATECMDWQNDELFSAAAPAQAKRSLADLVEHLDESFSQMLLRLIDEKGMTDVETYKRANIDRKLFSKIRKGGGYNPSKNTALALAIALRLNLDETRDLLAKAGYALSHSSKFDVIIEYFIVEGNYDIYVINEALFAFDQKLLGA